MLVITNGFQRDSCCQINQLMLDCWIWTCHSTTSTCAAVLRFLARVVAVNLSFILFIERQNGKSCVKMNIVKLLRNSKYRFKSCSQTNIFLLRTKAYWSNGNDQQMVSKRWTLASQQPLESFWLVASEAEETWTSNSWAILLWHSGVWSRWFCSCELKPAT